MSSSHGPHPQPGQPATKRKKWPLLLGGLVLLIIIIAVASQGGGDSSPTATGTDPNPATQAADTADGTLVMYEVTGPAKATNVTYTKEGFQMEQVANPTLPFRKELTFTDTVTGFSGLSLVAQNGQASGDITCRILVDGKEVANSTSSGAYAVVSCTGANI